MRSSICILPLIAVTVSAMAAASDGRVEGKASGTMTCNGRKSPLANAYAYRAADPSGGKMDQVVVVLTDQSVVRLMGHAPADDLDEYELSKLADAGKIHVLMVVVGADKRPQRATLYGNDLTRPVQASAELDLTQMDDKGIAGRTSSSGPMDTGADKFEWSASFQAPLALPSATSGARKPTTTRKLEGTPPEPAATTAASLKVGVLAIESDPPDAYIKIDGEMKGSTPADVEIPLGKAIDIVVHAVGHRDYHQAGYVLGQARADLKIKLELK